MIKKINKYLLTHYPLLWNTKIVWVLLANIIIHILYLISGIVSTHADGLQEYSYRGDATVHVFSVLCCIAVLICWLIFYLRNNSFKNFYRIDKFHLIKESLIVILIIFTSITYHESYYYGVRIKTRAITSKEELVKEANTINLAMTFIPQNKENYFILNNDTSTYVPPVKTDDVDDDVDSTVTTDSVVTPVAAYSGTADYTDTVNFPLRDSGYIRIRAALKRPDAFSYSNFCTVTVDLSEPVYTNYNYVMSGGSPEMPKHPDDYMPLATWYTIKNRWIANGQKDSIKNVLDQFKTICHKYGIYYPLNSTELTAYVFADPNHNISKIIPSTEVNDQKEDIYYFEEYPLGRAIDAVNGCYSNTISEYFAGDFMTELFLTLCFCILLLSYRWYSKKVFLISVIGTIVWSIIFGLIGTVGESITTVCYSFLILFTLFMLIGSINVHRKRLKVISGVLLTWSCYGIPFVVFALTEIVDSNYYDRYYTYNALKDKLMRRDHPIIYWIHNNGTIIYHCNLIFICLFIVLCYSRLSKKWHIMPEE